MVPKIFTDRQILLSTLLGSSVAGGYLMQRNTEFLADAEQGGVYIGIGVVFVGIAVVFAQAVNHALRPLNIHLPELPLFLLFQLVSMKILYSFRQEKEVKGILSAGQVEKGNWKEVFLVSVAALALVWIAMMGIERLMA